MSIIVCDLNSFELEVLYNTTRCGRVSGARSVTFKQVAPTVLEAAREVAQRYVHPIISHNGEVVYAWYNE